MERLTYKFNSLSLANFAANTIKKDGVGVVLANNNGFIVVETADAASVQEIANSARGYEVLREATPTMPQQKPVGMVRPANPVVARLVNYKVPMFLVKQYPALKKKKDSMPGSRIMWSHTSGDNDLDVISAKEVDSYLKDGWVIIEQLDNGEWQVEILTEKKKLTPDQLKKVHTGVAAQMQAKKGAKKEEIEEEEEEEIEEIYDGQRGRAAMQSNIKKAPTPKDREELVKLHNAIKKSPKVYGVSTDALGDLDPDETPSRKKLTPMAARAVDGYDAKNTDRSVNLEIISKINKRIKEEKEEIEEFFEDGDNINEAKPLIGGQKKLDVNKNDKLDAQDFKLLRAKKTKKEEVEVNENTGLMTNLHHPKGKAVLNKSGKIVAIYKTERAARKHASTGKPVKEEVEEEMTEAFRFRQQDWENMRSKYKSGTPVSITLKSGKTVSGTLLRMDKYDQGFASKGHLLHVKTAKGNVKIDDVKVKGIQWNNDPKTKMSEEVEAIDEAMNNYIAFYNGKKMPVQAETSYKAQLKAIEMFKAPASKKHMVTVKLADNKAAFAANEEVEQVDELLTPMRDAITARERDKATADFNNPNLSAAQQKKANARASRAIYARLRARSNDGTVAGKAQIAKFKRENEKWRKVEKSVKEEADITEAATAIKAGMRLYAKQDKKTDNGSVVKGQYYKVADAGGGLFNLIHQSTGYRKAMIKVTASAIQAMIQNKIF